MAWLLSFLIVTANFFIGRKNKWGWVIFTICNILYFYYAVWYLVPSQWGLVPAIVLNTVISVSSAYKWFKEDKDGI